MERADNVGGGRGGVGKPAKRSSTRPGREEAPRVDPIDGQPAVMTSTGR